MYREITLNAHVTEGDLFKWKSLCVFLWDMKMYLWTHDYAEEIFEAH